jgi:hypothetical protein
MIKQKALDNQALSQIDAVRTKDSHRDASPTLHNAVL